MLEAGRKEKIVKGDREYGWGHVAALNGSDQSGLRKDQKQVRN